MVGDTASKEEMVLADGSSLEPVVPPVETPFTLKDWRLWVVSFGFFWTLFVCGFVSMLSFERLGGDKYMTEQILTLPLIGDTIFAILAPLVFVIATRYPIQRQNRVARSLLYLAGGVGFTIAHVFIRVLCYPVWQASSKKFVWALIDWPMLHFSFHWELLRGLFLWNLVEDISAVFIPTVVIAHAALYYRRFRERELRAAQLQAQLSDARLLALRSQLQPHFLFNTLHSISSLMLRDVRAADTMIARLSDLLRMSLQDDGQHITSLKRELDFTQAYLDIEKIRLGPRLTANFEIAPETLDAPVPHLLLQPLVENSIKHGIAKSNAGGEVTVTAKLVGDKLSVSVSDRLFDQARIAGSSGPAIGIGLKGIRERLRTLYGEDQHFETRSLGGGAFEVSILLPFRAEDRLIHYGSRVEGAAAVGEA